MQNGSSRNEQQRKQETMGERIRRLRKERQLTQQDLADALYIANKSKISRVENDREELTLHQMASVAKILHTTMDYLVTGELPDVSDPLLEEAVAKFQKLQSREEKRAAIIMLEQMIVLVHAGQNAGVRGRV